MTSGHKLSDGGVELFFTGTGILRVGKVHDMVAQWSLKPGILHGFGTLISALPDSF
jgi:hypothetical protein